MANRPILEVCVASVDEAVDAENAGADRLELNSGLQLGGLTPSPATLIEVVNKCSIPVIAMARPRPGGFSYSRSDWKSLVADAHWMAEQGASGIAFGCLTPDREVDEKRVAEVRRRFSHMELVYHRAFDLVDDWRSAIECLIEQGIDRVMTSGSAARVPDGVDRISEVVAFCQNRIGVIPAGGVTPCNLKEVVQATHCHEIHGTFSSEKEDPGYLEGPIRFADNDSLRAVNPDKVRRAKAALVDCFPNASSP